MQIASRVSAMADGGGGVIPPAYWGLYFEAEDPAATIGMTCNKNWQGNPKVSLEYSTDGETWASFSVQGGSITLAAAGDRVFFRAGSSGNTALAYYSGGTYGCKFSITGGRAGAHGNIMSLLDATDETKTTITGSNAFRELFYNCTLLTSAPDLPATTLASSAYNRMFWGCTGLLTPPTIDATTLASSCCQYMFSGCTSLASAPTLPATTLASSCYQYMFQNCTSLASAPSLPATTLQSDCYYAMFTGCTALTVAPAMAATALANNCCRSMYYGCTSLVEGPELPDVTPSNYCYEEMFRDCASLRSLKVNFTNWGGGIGNWVNGVSATGTFTCPSALGDNATISRGNYYCPNGWAVVNT